MSARTKTAPPALAFALALAFCAAFATTAAAADLRHRVAVAGGYDAQLAPSLFEGHGWGLVAWDLDGLPRDAHLHASLNTDTLRLAYDRVSLADGLVEVGGRASGELFFAGLLMDYYRDGEKLPERGIQASYVSFGGYVKLNLPRSNYVALDVDVRRWFFATRGGTDPALALPPEAWVLEPRLSWTFWRVENDPSLSEAHRPFPRVRGVAFGLSLGVDVRSDARPWGALETGDGDASAFDPSAAPAETERRDDPRNDPDRAIVLFRQWLRAGSQLHDRLRVQLFQTAAWGHGEDDLTRVRLGGANPYVVPIVGAPWASLLAGRFVAAELSAHVRVWRELEVGVLGHGALVADVHRVGDLDDFGLVGGLGAFLDLRFHGFQIDVRGGWTPSLGNGEDHWGVVVGGGWQWSSN